MEWIKEFFADPEVQATIKALFAAGALWAIQWFNTNRSRMRERAELAVELAEAKAAPPSIARGDRKQAAVAALAEATGIKPEKLDAQVEAAHARIKRRWQSVAPANAPEP